MGLPAIGLAFTIGSGVMSAVNGFAQAGVAKAQAAAQQEAARRQQQAADANYALQINAIDRLNQEQAVATTAVVSDRMAQALRNLGTLQTVMSERGFTSNSFVGLANDIYNSESVDIARANETYQNQASSNRSRMDAAGQEFKNQYADANSKIAAAEQAKSVASTSAWLNGFGSLIKIGGGYIGDQIKLDAAQTSYDRLLQGIRSGGPVSPYIQ